VHPVLYVVIAYLIGSFPSAYIYTRLFSGGRDIRAVGSGNVGGMNTFRNVGALAGVLTGLTDLGKGVLAVWLAGVLFARDPVVMGAAAIAVVAGHNWMPWLGFRGGKGIGATAGSLIVLQPWALAPVIVLYAIGLLLTKDSYASVVIAFACLPIAMFALGGMSLLHALVGAGLAAVVIAKHWKELIGFLKGRREVL
jgi:acyl phosphate:glycerol-3-phosphate acyltransferase